MEALSTIYEYLRTGVVLMVVLTVLVAVHELGHYWVAKLVGMKVKAFAIMVGGVRKSDLSTLLDRPLMPARIVWALGIASLIVTVVGASMNLTLMFTLGLALIGVVIPLWIGLRLEKLYHLRPGASLIMFGICWAVSLVLLVVATRLQGVTAPGVLSIMLYGSLVAVCLLYYRPVLGKPEGGEMGVGQIQIEGKPEQVQFRPIWSRVAKDGTEFSFLLLPLGGFAAIKGMEAKEDGSEVEIEEGFYSKPPLARLAVLFAGPLFSILFGAVIFIGLFTGVGEFQLINEPVINAVIDGSPAEAAGLEANDRILAVNGEPVDTWYELVSSVRDLGGQEVALVVERGGETLDVTLVPEKTDQPVPVIGPDLELTGEMRIQGRIGAEAMTAYVPMTLGAAVARTAQMPYEIVQSLAGVIVRPKTAKDVMGGPASVAQVTNEASKSGIVSVLLLTAALSISLGVLNLLPFPPLDGGQMLVAFVELLRGGKRLSLGTQNALTTVGMLLVALIVVTGITLDMSRYSGKDEPSPPNAEQNGDQRYGNDRKD